jgi:hypothetical protein
MGRKVIFLQPALLHDYESPLMERAACKKSLHAPWLGLAAEDGMWSPGYGVWSPGYGLEPEKSLAGLGRDTRARDASNGQPWWWETKADSAGDERSQGGLQTPNDAAAKDVFSAEPGGKPTLTTPTIDQAKIDAIGAQDSRPPGMKGGAAQLTAAAETSCVDDSDGLVARASAWNEGRGHKGFSCATGVLFGCHQDLHSVIRKVPVGTVRARQRRTGAIKRPQRFAQ